MYHFIPSLKMRSWICVTSYLRKNVISTILFKASQIRTTHRQVERILLYRMTSYNVSQLAHSLIFRDSTVQYFSRYVYLLIPSSRTRTS